MRVRISPWAPDSQFPSVKGPDPDQGAGLRTWAGSLGNLGQKGPTRASQSVCRTRAKRRPSFASRSRRAVYLGHLGTGAVGQRGDRSTSLAASGRRTARARAHRVHVRLAPTTKASRSGGRLRRSGCTARRRRADGEFFLRPRPRRSQFPRCGDRHLAEGVPDRTARHERCPIPTFRSRRGAETGRMPLCTTPDSSSIGRTANRSCSTR